MCNDQYDVLVEGKRTNNVYQQQHTTLLLWRNYILSVVVVGVYDRQYYQSISISIILCVYLLMHIVHRPYTLKRMNRYDILISIVYVVYSIMYSIDVVIDDVRSSDGSISIVYVCMCVCISIIVIVHIYILVVEIVKYIDTILLHRNSTNDDDVYDKHKYIDDDGKKNSNDDNRIDDSNDNDGKKSSNDDNPIDHSNDEDNNDEGEERIKDRNDNR